MLWFWHLFFSADLCVFFCAISGWGSSYFLGASLCIIFFFAFFYSSCFVSRSTFLWLNTTCGHIFFCVVCFDAGLPTTLTCFFARPHPVLRPLMMKRKEDFLGSAFHIRFFGEKECFNDDDVTCLLNSLTDPWMFIVWWRRKKNH